MFLEVLTDAGHGGAGGRGASRAAVAAGPGRGRARRARRVGSRGRSQGDRPVEPTLRSGCTYGGRGPAGPKPRPMVAAGRSGTLPGWAGPGRLGMQMAGRPGIASVRADPQRVTRPWAEVRRLRIARSLPPAGSGSRPRLRRRTIPRRCRWSAGSVSTEPGGTGRCVLIGAVASVQRVCPGAAVSAAEQCRTSGMSLAPSRCRAVGAVPVPVVAGQLAADQGERQVSGGGLFQQSPARRGGVVSGSVSSSTSVAACSCAASRPPRAVA